MKFTEKLKAKKADKIENPAKETAKKEKKPLKQITIITKKKNENLKTVLIKST